MLSFEWLATHLNTSLSSEDKQTIEEHYGQLNKRCPNAYNDAIIIMMAKIKNSDQEHKYRLKAGISFIYMGVIYTHINLTDKAAIWYLKNGGNPNYFHAIPTDVKFK